MTTETHWVTKEEMPLVLSYLKNELPISGSAYLHAKLVNSGFSGYRIITQGWPDCKGVMVLPDIKTNKTVDQDEYDDIATLYATEQCDLQMLFKSSGSFDLEHINLKGVLYTGMTATIADQVQTGLEMWSGGTFQGVPLHASYVPNIGYYATAISITPKLPSGYRDRRLSIADTDQILERRPRHTVRKIKRILQFTKLSIGVENESGDLVGWAFKVVQGYIGMTFVEKAHRRLGIGRYVTATLGREIINEDGFCMTIIDPSNYISKCMHESVGFQELKGVRFSSLLLKKQK